ncbi:MAG: InlB B-repeat-containing protein, partial [Clostridiaceae bacterium]|nr:InlB B-repeat-containing protein [Clostridiaceae bacterium]
MKKTRILAFLLSLCMLTALLPTTVLAATDTYDVPASTLVYELSGTSSNDHTTANYAWTNGGMLYLALTTREDKPVLTSNVIIAGVPYSLTVPSDRYDFLAIDNVSYGAIGKLSNQTYKWQIVSCSYGQSLALNQTLTLSTTAQGGGFELHGAAYTVSGTVQETYAVTYTYAFDPTAPDNAPSAPTDPNLYMENSSVTLATEPSVEGYTFTGWSSTDVTLPLPGGTFTMPSSNVTITGSFVKNAIPIKFYILDPTIVVPVDGKNMGSGSYYPVANWQASSQTYIYETNLPGTLSNAILTQLAGSDGKLTVGDKLLVEDIDSSLLSGIEYPSDVSAALTRFGLSGSGYTPVAYVIKAQNPNNYVGSVGDDWFGYDDNNNPCDIHVDCYLSPVPVSVTYHSNFNPDSTYQTAVMNTGTVYTVLGYNDTNLPLNGQSSFLGWATSSTGDVVFTANNTFTVMGNSHLYAKWGTTPPVTTPVTYAIHYYFEDAVGTVKQSATVDSGSAPAVSNASVSYKPASVLLSYDSTKTYVLDTTKTSSSFV